MLLCCMLCLPARAVLALLVSVALVLPAASDAASALKRVKERGVLLWGSDSEGGAPYVFPDPKDPSKLIGFELDIVEAVAAELGVRQQLVQTAWDSLVPALERGDYDMAMNGLEIIPERRQRVLMSRPYYIYTLQLMVRKDDDRIRSIRDLPGRTVGTLAGATAHTMLQRIGGVDIRSYSAAWPYEDLALGRLDAVFLDTPITVYYGKPDKRLREAGPPEGEGFYGIAFRKQDADLQQAVDRAIEKLLRTGELKQILEHWGLWDAAQAGLITTGQTPGAGDRYRMASEEAPWYTFLPNLLRGAAMTVLLSVVSMALAIALGLALAVLRFSGARPARLAAMAYVEVYRGTPLLVQLFILYYGLPNIGIALSPLAAAIIGLGMNYAAYEAEVYRAGIEAVPRGQMEAALSLGMPRSLALRRIILPQAFRVSLPAVTNDFIALFKDSSIVSVIAMVELTKTYGILAATTLRYFELGLIVAVLYFGMSYPLSVLARRLERRLKGH